MKQYHLLLAAFLVLLWAHLACANGPMGNQTTMLPGMGQGMPMFNMPDRPWFSGPQTLEMAGPMGELNAVFNNNGASGLAADFASMTQASDGTLMFYSREAGRIFSYMAPKTGFNAAQTSGSQGPSVSSGQDGSVVMITSYGTFDAMPYFHNLDDFRSLVDNALNLQMQMTYQTDGSFMFNYDLQHSVCLQADPEADVSAGNGSPGISLPPGFTEFSPIMLRYTDGFSQNFRPAFAHAAEVMASLGGLTGMSNPHINQDGSISATWVYGQTSYMLTLIPSMILTNPTSQTNLAPGFIQGQDGSWWYIYANGIQQRFQIQGTNS